MDSEWVLKVQADPPGGGVEAAVIPASMVLIWEVEVGHKAPPAGGKEGSSLFNAMFNAGVEIR
ncbi:hypothetical protein PAXRUDRAFT_22098 [Paxillus rubicundulus Ve08.2h10]|uniref:Unplaced genomic scaffold scaffold_6116, whole genome shotgun sequence n=1 Tax=Paxillus rubicundulus Ve08.2h10 TaxID=930991 RepID=A0A0D0C9Q7_9AGAM|nr:hypothetical protein PAXRUDRAFT_22098 [Paxillus rubicundulus Ve08.2h10]